MRIKTKDIIVTYKGGGYSGCIWEANLFAFNSKGEFDNIFSSGGMGVKKVKDALKLLRNNNPSDDINIYRLTDNKTIDKFQKKEPVPLVVGTINHMACDNNYEHKPWFICKICGEKSYGGHPESGEAAQAESWHGCGGIASTADDMICGQCHSDHTCEYCGEFDSDSKFGFCQYHFNEGLKNLIAQDNYKYIEHDTSSNKFVEGAYDDENDINLDSWKESKGTKEVIYLVTLQHPDYENNLTVMILATNKKLAVDYVDQWTGGEHYRITDVKSGFDYVNENIDNFSNLMRDK